ncbi:AraC family transcriptional regulator [Streptacidiphilus pinicola]|uniref:AraC family transcriptional regulator n=1 Tax=Streptacidiphilus pinicola TaxID=2219663 RepID=A0A2X0IB10_9ACTN|nr:helix-turn-helix domain-containing protein [Streptacidiphilus pinicola]RAG82152.1 AraC family transcriptional regulator [Streptacidiphilus pinicola]
MATRTASRPHEVAVLAMEGVVAFELSTPSRVFESAHEKDEAPHYRVRTCSLDGEPVRTSSDFRVVVEHGPELLAEADTVIVPASFELGPVFTDGRLTPELERALGFVRPGTRVVSICTGSFVLAAAGLLDGRRATTHWRYTDRFRQLFPQVLLDPDVLFTDDGEVLTSGGVAAGIDLCLHIVRRDLGSAVANHVARRCVVAPWREGGQAQYVEVAVPEPGASGTAPARAHALEHLADNLTLGLLAERCGMSVRTFTRRFREETGQSPVQWLLVQRVHRARRLLEQGELTVDRVAHAVGFGSAASLRQHMHSVLGVSPTAYRRTFKAVD